MKIINAQGAVPTNEDGLIIYCDSYTPTNAPKTVKIQTQVRHLYMVMLQAVISSGRVSTAVYETQFMNLGYTEGINSNNEKYVTTDIPAGCFLRYFIVGNDKITNPVSPELSETATPVVALSSVKRFDVLIAAAGTSGVERLNTTGATMTYTLAATGQYHIAASVECFGSTDKLIGYVTLEGATESFAEAYHVVLDWIDSQNINVNVYLTGTLTNAPHGVYVSLTIYP